MLCPGGVRTRIAFANRNQPGHEGALEPGEAEATMVNAMDPADIAEQGFAAVRDDQFVVYPLSRRSL